MQEDDALYNSTLSFLTILREASPCDNHHNEFQPNGNTRFSDMTNVCRVRLVVASVAVYFTKAK